MLLFRDYGPEEMPGAVPFELSIVVGTVLSVAVILVLGRYLHLL